ncbi:MAG: hypothetical protein ACOY4O_06725 [Pseudomonadota bacterium]
MSRLCFNVRLLLLAVLLGSPAGTAHAEGETRIKVEYGILAVRAPPSNASGVARHSFSIVLKANNQISESYEGGGRHRITKEREVSLGSSSDPRVKYRVVDANTIQRIQDNKAHIATFTIKVSGSSCTLSYEAKLKPGETEYVSFSQSTGKMERYTSFTLAHQTCTIQ